MLVQLKETDAKLRKSYSSDSNLEPHNLNMKSNGTVMSITIIAVSMQKILISSFKQTTGHMPISHTNMSSSRQANPHMQDLKENKPSDKYMTKHAKS